MSRATGDTHSKAVMLNEDKCRYQNRTFAALSAAQNFYGTRPALIVGTNRSCTLSDTEKQQKRKAKLNDNRLYTSSRAIEIIALRRNNWTILLRIKQR